MSPPAVLEPPPRQAAPAKPRVGHARSRRPESRVLRDANAHLHQPVPIPPTRRVNEATLSSAAPARLPGDATLVRYPKLATYDPAEFEPYPTEDEMLSQGQQRVRDRMTGCLLWLAPTGAPTLTSEQVREMLSDWP